MFILTLGQKLRRLRKNKGLTLEALGEEYVSKAHLSIIENDKASPSISLLKFLADKLEVDLEFLLETEKEQAIRFCRIWMKEMEAKIKLNRTNGMDELYNNVERMAKEYDLLDIQGECNMLFAQGSINERDYETALEYIQKSIHFSTKADNTTRIIKAYNKEGNIYLNKSMYEIAIQKYRQAFIFYENLPHEDLTLKSNILFNISNAYHKLKDKINSVKYAEAVCKINKEISHPKRYAESLLHCSTSYILNEDYQAAEKVLEQANALLDKEEEHRLQSLIENNLGMVYLDYGDSDKAYSHLLKAKELKEKYSIDDLPNTLFELCRFYIKNGKIEKAFEELGYAMNLSKERNLESHKVKGLNIYIDYYLDQNRYSEAVEKLKELIDVLTKIESKDNIVGACLKLGNTLNLTNQKEEAIFYFNKAYSMLKE